MSQSTVPAVREHHRWPILRGVLAAAAFLLAAGWQAPALAADAPAGSSITNVASLRYEVDGAQATVASNPAVLAVAERLDVTLTRAGGDPVTLATGVAAVPFVLTNTGNGSEAFELDATLDGDDSRVRLIALDRNGDGRFDPAEDAALPERRTAALAARGSLRLLVVVDTPADAAGGSLVLAAHALTGSGQPGMTIPGKGDGGSDAVIGETGAVASVPVPLSGDGAAPTLAKSQSVLAPDGSTNAVRGAVITYTLLARFPAAVAAATVSDPVPAGTTYMPGSLTLDGTALTDAADADAGAVGADGIGVVLGAVTGPAIHSIRFNVIIQ